jgi:hypothetical protein
VPGARPVRRPALLEAIKVLLDPNVPLGAPDDPDQSCENREQVLAWYGRGREAGVRAHVTETTAYGDRILAGVNVRGRAGMT